MNVPCKRHTVRPPSEGAREQFGIGSWVCGEAVAWKDVCCSWEPVPEADGV